jgi:hypothetical protein
MYTVGPYRHISWSHHPSIISSTCENVLQGNDGVLDWPPQVIAVLGGVLNRRAALHLVSYFSLTLFMTLHELMMSLYMDFMYFSLTIIL